jgi:hypothetical protein
MAYLYRAIDQSSQVIDVLVSTKQDQRRPAGSSSARLSMPLPSR